MHLEEFFNYKNTLMKDLLTEESIVELIDSGTSLENARSLAYNQVMPCEFYPDTIEDGKTYVCFDVDIEKVYNNTLYRPTLYIWIFTHKSLLRLSGGGLRVDKLCGEIDKKINGSLKYGLGRLSLDSVKRFAPLEDYTGKQLKYLAEDFNLAGEPIKNVPANRKKQT